MEHTLTASMVLHPPCAQQESASMEVEKATATFIGLVIAIFIGLVIAIIIVMLTFSSLLCCTVNWSASSSCPSTVILPCHSAPSMCIVTVKSSFGVRLIDAKWERGSHRAHVVMLMDLPRSMVSVGRHCRQWEMEQ